jgi:hypothetical protein
MNINDNNTNTIDNIHEFITIHENNWYLIVNIHEFYIIVDESNWKYFQNHNINKMIDYFIKYIMVYDNNN